MGGGLGSRAHVLINLFALVLFPRSLSRVMKRAKQVFSFPLYVFIIPSSSAKRRKEARLTVFPRPPWLPSDGMYCMPEYKLPGIALVRPGSRLRRYAVGGRRLVDFGRQHGHERPSRFGSEVRGGDAPV